VAIRSEFSWRCSWHFVATLWHYRPILVTIFFGRFSVAILVALLDDCRGASWRFSEDSRRRFSFAIVVAKLPWRFSLAILVATRSDCRGDFVAIVVANLGWCRGDCRDDSRGNCRAMIPVGVVAVSWPNSRGDSRGDPRGDSRGDSGDSRCDTRGDTRDAILGDSFA
jgi:hypothetical protein